MPTPSAQLPLAVAAESDMGGFSQAPIPAADSSVDPAQLLQQIKSMEARIKTLESGKVATFDNPKVEHEAKDSRSTTELTPTVRWCSWDEYKNYFGSDDGKDSIDVLRAGQQLEDDVRQEVSRRVLFKEGTFDAATAIPSFSAYRSEASWIRRLRLKSKIVLSVLARVSAKYGIYHIDSNMPATFLEPFDPLIFVHAEFKTEVGRLQVKENNDLRENLETRGLNQTPDHLEPDQGISSNQTGDINTSGKPSNYWVSKSKRLILYISGQAQKLEELGFMPINSVTPDDIKMLLCYIDFMDKHVMPRHELLRFGKASDDFPKKVRYDELWSLFQPGELIYVPPPSQVGRPQASIEQRILRIIQIHKTEAA